MVVSGLWASGKETLNSLDDGNCEQPSSEITRGGPVELSGYFPPFDFDGAEWGDDGGSLGVLVFVEDDGRDALHKTTRARHTG